MNKGLTDEILIELYEKNYTLKEIAILYDYSMSAITRRVKKLIDNDMLTERPNLRKNRITRYGKDDRITINIKDNNSTRVITDEDIMTLVGYGFKQSRIALITGLNIAMIIDIVKKYKDQNIPQPKINKWYVIELYNNKFNKFQIHEITGYDNQSIMATINQAMRAGFINRDLEYIPSIKEKIIMDMYRNYISINNIAISNNLSKSDAQLIIEDLINKGLLEQRNNATRILNRRRINLGIEDDNILRMYNLCISEDCIARYYKVNKNTIIDAICKIDKEKIKIYDKISDLIKQRKTIKQISNILDIPLEVLYDHLREVIR